MSTLSITPANGKKNLVGGVYHVLYSAPAGCVSATVNARITSHDLTQNTKIRMAIVPSSFAEGNIAPSNDCWISPIDMVLGPNGISVGSIEDTALVLSPGEQIVVMSDIGNATARAHGLVRTVV